MYKLLFDTDHYVVIDKHPGYGFHSEHGRPGIAEQLKTDLGVQQLYPLHRLDRMTSGLLVFAKDLATAQALNAQFRQRQVGKFYLALSDRKPKKKQGLIQGDMEKGRRGNWKLLPSRRNPAITRFVSCSVSPGLRLYLLKPLTGKTHQLRVAMKSLGAPIIGDQRYHADDGTAVDRGYLHAYALSFEVQGEQQRFLCPPSEGVLFKRPDVQQALQDYRDPWALSWPGED